MAVVRELPNGYLVVVLSPREATLFNDELLPPETFPWQHSESEMVALEVKMQIRQLIEKRKTTEMHVIGSMALQQIRQDEGEEVDEE